MTNITKILSFHFTILGTATLIINRAFEKFGYAHLPESLEVLAMIIATIAALIWYILDGRTPT